MLTLPLALRQEKNKLIGTAPWLLLMSITLPDTSVIRVARNTEDVVFGGNTYTAFGFDLGETRSGGDGRVQGVTLKIANPSRSLTPYLESFDGLVGCAVVVYVVHADNLASDYTELTLNWTILSTNVPDDEWIEFQLGAENPIRKKFPLYSVNPLTCHWIFKGVECAYSGGDTTCERTLDDCRTKSNSARFGGRPGVNGAPRFSG